MWAVARICQVSFNPIVKSTVPILKSPVSVRVLDLANSATLARQQVLRKFTNTKWETVSHALRRTRQRQKVPPEAAFTVGRAAVSTVGAAGLATLCYYGIGLSRQDSILDRAALWPQYIRDRIKTTYMYVGGSVIVATLTAVQTLRSPTMMRVLGSGNILVSLGLLGSLIASTMVVNSIPYSPGFGAKQLSWLAFSSLVGLSVAPIAFYGGQLLLRAALYTSGIVGGLSAIAVTAPSEKFLNMYGILGIGCGVVFVSGIGSMFLPPVNLLGAGLHSIFLYGGLILFSGMLLYNTQNTIRLAEQMPPVQYGGQMYDPVRQSMSIFLDIVNIFIRLVVIFDSNKKR